MNTIKNLDISPNDIHALPPDCGWYRRELAQTSFGDRRIDERFNFTVEKLAALPLAPINQASDNWADTKASYRLFDNDKVSIEKILESHKKETYKRIEGQKIVLAVQDTTNLNFNSHSKTTGLGPIGKNQYSNIQGLLLHSVLAFTPDGLPLGIIGSKIWSRENSDNLTKSEKNKLMRQKPIEDKESFRWLEGLEETVYATPPGTKMVTICDREADIYEFLAKADDLDSSVLVRAKQDRELDPHENELDYVSEVLSDQPSSGKITIDIPAQNKKPARTATLEIRFAEVTLNKTKFVSKSNEKRMAPELKVSFIWAHEVETTVSVDEKVNWVLLTNDMVSNFNSAVEKINWYCCRWGIEIFFKILKSGCKVEDCRLETAERLKRYIATFCIIAYRIHFLTYVARTNPSASCTTVLSESEWKALFCRINGTTICPENPPTVREAIRWIGQLGGFLRRKQDKEPGVTALWRGWQRLTESVVMWSVFNKNHI